MIPERVYPGTVTVQSSHLQIQDPLFPSPPSITRTPAMFLRIFSARRRAVTGSTAVTNGERRAARIQKAPTFAPISITRSSGRISWNQYLRYIKDLAIGCRLFQEKDAISSGKIGRGCHFYPEIRNPMPRCQYGQGCPFLMKVPFLVFPECLSQLLTCIHYDRDPAMPPVLRWVSRKKRGNAFLFQRT